MVKKRSGCYGETSGTLDYDTRNRVGVHGSSSTAIHSYSWNKGCICKAMYFTLVPLTKRHEVRIFCLYLSPYNSNWALAYSRLSVMRGLFFSDLTWGLLLFSRTQWLLPWLMTGDTLLIIKLAFGRQDLAIAGCDIDSSTNCLQAWER